MRHRFGANGYIDLVVRDFQYWHQGAMDLTQIGFFVTTLEAEAQLEVDLAQVGAAALRPRQAQHALRPLRGSPAGGRCARRRPAGVGQQAVPCPSARRDAQGACALDAQNVVKLLTFDKVEANRKAGHDATALNVHLPEAVRDYAGGEFSLFFANCQASFWVACPAHL